MSRLASTGVVLLSLSLLLGGCTGQNLKRSEGADEINIPGASPLAALDFHYVKAGYLIGAARKSTIF
jgi:hypothetical protein